MINGKSLSIVIPTYNGAGSLIDLILDLYNTFNFENFEIIVVNDASPDLTDIKFEQNQNNFKKFKYILLEENIGEDKAVELGLEYAEYNSILIIDDDYQHTPNACKMLYENFIQNDCDVIYSKYIIKKHSFFRNLGSKIFNYLYLFSNKKKIYYVSSFKIISRDVKNKFLEYNKRKKIFIDDYLISNNFKIKFKEVEHNQRNINKSNYNLINLSAIFFKRLTNRFSFLGKIIQFLINISLVYLIYKILKVFFNVIILNEVYPTGYPTILILLVINLLLSYLILTKIIKKIDKTTVKKILKSKLYEK